MEKKDYCCIFSIQDPQEAYNSMDFSLVEEYDRWDYIPHYIHKWDVGGRELLKCRKCGKYVLHQNSEWHRSLDDFEDLYIPIQGHDEAIEINKTFNGYDINGYNKEKHINRPCLEYHSSEDPSFEGSWFWYIDEDEK